MKVANKLSRIAPFRVMELLARANELAALGHDVIHLEVGEPDFPTPAPIVAAGRKALDLGETKYTDARGLIELRSAVSEYYQRRFEVEVSSDRIFITAGASGGLLLLTAALMNAGENLLMTDPGYPCNRHFLSVFNAEGRLVPVTPEEGYQLTPSLIEQYWDAQTRGILLASPANPTGAVTTPERMSQLCEAVRQRSGLVIVDEIYQGLTYDDTPDFSVLQLNADAAVVNSFSKYFGMTGWRLGWLVVPEEICTDLEKLAQNLFICPSTIAQHAALAAFSEESIEEMENHRAAFKQRRDFMVPAIRSLGLDVKAEPGGAFYIYAELPEALGRAEQFCERLLEEQFVAVTPGTDFGFVRADRHIRISYARDLSQLQEAVVRMRKLIES